MAKLVKQYYYSMRDKDKRVNCYKLTLSKEILKEAGIDPEQEVELKSEKGKIIIKNIDIK